jgi:hypothetical protein
MINFLNRLAGPLPGLFGPRPVPALAPVHPTGVFAPRTSRDVLRPSDS